jgi:hypothetical protein
VTEDERRERAAARAAAQQAELAAERRSLAAFIGRLPERLLAELRPLLHPGRQR